MEKTEKTTEFYKIKLDRPSQIDFDLINHNDTSYVDECVQIIKNNIRKLLKSDKPEFESNNNFIEFYNCDDKYAFGIIGKSNSVERGMMKRIRDRKGNEVVKTEYREENLRYFVLKFSDLNISIIKNYQAPKIVELFTIYIKSVINDSFPNILVYINPIIDNDVIGKVGKMNKLCKLGIKFSSDSTLSRYALNLDKIYNYNSNNVIGTIVEIKFENQIMPNKLKDFIDDEGNLSNFERFEITGDSDDNKQTVELIKRHLIKKVPLNLSDEELTDAEKYLDKIKEALIKSFD